MLIARFHTFLLSAEATSALLMRTATKTCWPHVLISHIAVTYILCRRGASVQRKSIKFLATKNRPYQLRYFWLSICLSIHPWRYSPFRDLASLIIRLHSSLFAALLLHPLIPSSYRASLWTTFVHLVLGLPTGLSICLHLTSRKPRKDFFSGWSTFTKICCPI